MGAPQGAGDLRDFVRVERRGDTAGDGAGNYEDDWGELINKRSAKIEPLRGGETVIAQRAAGTALYDIWLRYDPETKAIAASDRLFNLDGSLTVYNVHWAEPWTVAGRKQWVRIQAEKGVADG